jgi:hypothetical protein
MRGNPTPATIRIPPRRSDSRSGPRITKGMTRCKAGDFLLFSAFLAPLLGCMESSVISAAETPSRLSSIRTEASDRTPRLALWLAKKGELSSNTQASYDLVMSAWFEPGEAEELRGRRPSMKILAGLSHTWIYNDPGWLEFLITAANGGDPQGPLQITEDMYLVEDSLGGGKDERKCSPPGWDKIFAMDPRHPGWRKLILSFYQTVATQPQHDGVVIDMLDAYPFCEGSRSGGVPDPIDAAGWVGAQAEIVGLIREAVPEEKWVFANAGHDFSEGSPFPQFLNGYLLENFLGSWGATLEEGLASAERALGTTAAPHLVVFAADTDDTGEMNWARFRTGLAASLLLDNTFFAFDYGSQDHGGVDEWWFPAYYDLPLGPPLGAYTHENGVYRRDFQFGSVVIAAEGGSSVTFSAPHLDPASGQTGSEWTVEEGDARIFLQMASVQTSGAEHTTAR